MAPAKPLGGLRLEVTDDPAALGRTGAEIILKELKIEPRLLLCASAGGTPTETYRCLATRAPKSPGLFGRLRILQIDEWAGLPARHPASCETDLRMKLLDPLHVSGSRYVGFKSQAKDLEGECARVSRWLASNGPIDICVLGLGVNGHIAMNEPGDAAVPWPHVARLAPISQKHPMLKQLHVKPRYGMTLGLADILQSRKLLLLVSGAHKRTALAKLLRTQVNPRFPASFLWLHPDATVLCDRAAAPITPL